ncbi:MAG: PrpR N-terminal domain-containing protein, partial [Gammaproteobacteria bacterium]|nr:PrpR N-terminal domain-containing protein [Gammaproteobacteria bacterium]
MSAYELADVARSLAPRLAGRAVVQVLHGHFDQAVTELRRVIDAGRCDVVVSAGSNADFLRSRLDLPVVSVRVGGFDVMAALTEAGAGDARIALLFFQGVPAEVVRFVDDYRLPVALHAYDSEAHARQIVAKLVQDGVRAVVGPGVAVWAARAQ